MKADQERVRELLKDTIALLCRNGLAYDTELKIEGVLGITVNKNDVFIVHINEVMSNKEVIPSGKNRSNSVTHLHTQSSIDYQHVGNASENIQQSRHENSSVVPAAAELYDTHNNLAIVKHETTSNELLSNHKSRLNSSLSLSENDLSLNTSVSARSFPRQGTPASNGNLRKRNHPYASQSIEKRISIPDLGYKNISAGSSIEGNLYPGTSQSNSTGKWTGVASATTYSMPINRESESSNVLLIDDDDPLNDDADMDFKDFGINEDGLCLTDDGLAEDGLMVNGLTDDGVPGLADQGKVGAGRYVCEFAGCCLSFVHSYTLYRHQRMKHGRRHGAMQQQLFYCPYDQCGKSFCKEGTLRNHIRDVHTT